MQLRKAIVTGVKWSAASQFGRQGIQLITLVILAHLLAPEDFGLLGMATAVIGFLNIFKDLGTSAAIVQREELGGELLSSVYWVNVLFGLAATALLFVGSPLIAQFYQEPQVTAVLRVLSITFFISGLSILHQALLQRRLDFRAIAKVEITAVAAGAIVGIGMALAGRGVWSLVFQTITMATVTTLMLWLVTNWRPRIHIAWSELRSVAGYSLNLLGFHIFNYFARNADYLLIGRYLGAQALGYYTLAYRIMLYPVQNVSAVLGRVMFPAFSRLQTRLDRFRSGFLRASSGIAIITFPLMLGLAVVVEPFVAAILGEKWQPVVLLLAILAPVGMLQSIGATVGSIYQATGRTDWMFRWGVASGTVSVIGFVVGLKWGVVGVAVAYAITSVFLIYPGYAIPFRLISLPVGKLALVLWRPLLSSLIMGAVLFITRHVLPEQITSAQQLAILIPLGVATYGGAAWLIAREQVLELWLLLKRGSQPEP